MKIEVDENIAKEIGESLDGLMSRADEMLPYFEEQAQALDALIQFDVFEMSQSPFGKPWKPLAESTVKQRRSGDGPSPQMIKAKPLIDSNTMRLATFVSGREGYIEFGVGNDAPYAIHQQFGAKTKNDKWRPPPRPFLPVSGTKEAPDVDFSRGPAKEWYDDMVEGLADFLAEGAEGGG